MGWSAHARSLIYGAWSVQARHRGLGTVTFCICSPCLPKGEPAPHLQ